MKSATICQMPAAQYHADPCERPSLSSSIIKIMVAKSPLHAKLAHPRLNPQRVLQDSKTLDLGTAAHAMLFESGDGIVCLEPKDYPAKNGNIPEGWTNDAIRAARDSIRAAGKTPVLPNDFDAIKKMRDAAIRAIETCQDFPSPKSLASGSSEQTLIWQDSGIWCRARLDWLSNDQTAILDYKTTTDAAPSVFARQISRMQYHLQDAFYRRGIRALTGRDPTFIFLAQENEPPYACSFHGVDPSLAHIADAHVERCIRLWAQCLTHDAWPNYGDRIHWVGATNWQMIEHEEVEATGHPYDPATLFPMNERQAA